MPDGSTQSYVLFVKEPKIFIYLYLSISICLYIHLCIYIYIYIYLYLYIIYIYIYIYINIQCYAKIFRSEIYWSHDPWTYVSTELVSLKHGWYSTVVSTQEVTSKHIDLCLVVSSWAKSNPILGSLDQYEKVSIHNLNIYF